MSGQFFVATHKGLFTFRETASGWDAADVSFLGDSVTMVLEDSRDGTLYAALDHGHFGVKLQRRDAGGEWTEVGVPSYPEVKDAEKESGDILKEIWCLETGGEDEEARLWAGTIPGGLFVSDDRGDHWRLNEPLWNRPERDEWFGGGKDLPGIHSICRDPADSRKLVLGVSCGGVWTTADGGESWELKADGMHATYMPPEQQGDPQIQDVHRLAMCPSSTGSLWVQHHNAIYRSTDGADSWQSVTSDALPSVFGFAVVVHPTEPDTAWVVPAVNDDCRVPVDRRVVVARTRDGGISFDVLDNGLPPAPAYDIVFRHGLDIDRSGERLVLGSSTGGLWVSIDGGDNWQTISTHLPQIYCVRWAG